MREDVSIPEPTVVLNLMQAFRQSKTMFAAVSLGVFDALRLQPLLVSELAEQLRVHTVALERLLNACVELQLLQRTGDQYYNTPVADAYLTSSSPRRLTGYIHFSNQVTWQLWGQLENAVQTGHHSWQAAFGWDGPIFDHFFKTDTARHEFLMGMHGYGLISSPQVVQAFDLSRFSHLVDLGGATGHLAIAGCQRWPNLRATVFDLPAVTPLTLTIVADSPVPDRVAVVDGDFFSDPLPAGDLFALGRILHDWSEAKIVTLLQRIWSSLPDGGGLLIAEKMLNEDKIGPTWAQLQDLNMLTCTEGKERSFSEYAELLEQVGFQRVSGCRISAPLDAILAIKEK